jgi:hypothetical protein
MILLYMMQYSKRNSASETTAIRVSSVNFPTPSKLEIYFLSTTTYPFFQKINLH